MVISVLWVAVAGGASATGDLRYRAPGESALGLSSVVGGFVFDRQPGVRTRWVAESGQRYLFGIAGLKTTFLRLAVHRASTGLLLSAAGLSTPVGSEKLVTVTPFYKRPGRFLVTTGTSVSVTSVTGYRSVHLVTVSVALAAALSDGIAVGYRVQNVRAAGRGRPGGDMALYVVAWRDLPVSLIVNLAMDHDGRPGMVVASRVVLGRTVELGVGYDDGTGALRSSLAVRRHSLALAVGADHHPVLGLSKAFFVRWSWGR